MKRWSTISIIAILVVLIVISFFVYRQEKKENAEKASPTPPITVATQPTTSETYCRPNDLVTLLTSEGAAGSIYGTFTIKNTSSKPCTIIGNNKIDAIFTAPNVSVIYKGTNPATIQLSPGQTVYAQVQLPNGPQCNGPIKPVNISFQYTYAPQKTMTFKNTLGYENLKIAACANPTTMTTITLWPFSTTPYH